VNEIWTRIKSCAGETFQQIRGKKFSYVVNGDYVDLSSTNHRIPKKHFQEALLMVPLPSTVEVQHLRGPSYIYAILMDKRIRKTDW
jgi:hypothetical protein